MNRVKLTKICNPKQWKTIPTSELQKTGYPVYGANGVIGFYSEYNHEEPVIAITCRGATCGTVNLTEPKSYITGNAMCLDSVDKSVSLKYLFYAMNALDFSSVISGSAQPQITREGLEKVEINIHTENEQGKIISRLDKITDLINIRKEQLKKLDELIKSRFVEMFGGIKDDEKVAMSDICLIITDGTHQPPQFTTTGIPFIFVSNIVGNIITYDAEKFISEETYAELTKRTPLEIGDVLLSTVGSYGHPAVVKSDKLFCFQRHIAYLKPNKELIDSEYLHGAILSIDVQKQIEERVKGIAQKTLNLSEIRKIKLPLPTIDEQKQYTAFVEQVDKSKSEINKSLKKLELLKKSLMQKYFG